MSCILIYLKSWETDWQAMLTAKRSAGVALKRRVGGIYHMQARKHATEGIWNQGQTSSEVQYWYINSPIKGLMSFKLLFSKNVWMAHTWRVFGWDDLTLPSASRSGVVVTSGYLASLITPPVAMTTQFVLITTINTVKLRENIWPIKRCLACRNWLYLEITSELRKSQKCLKIPSRKHLLRRSAPWVIM